MKKVNVSISNCIDRYNVEWVFRYKYYWKVKRINFKWVLIYWCNGIWLMDNEKVMELMGEEYYNWVD